MTRATGTTAEAQTGPTVIITTILIPNNFWLALLSREKNDDILSPGRGQVMFLLTKL